MITEMPQWVVYWACYLGGVSTAMIIIGMLAVSSDRRADRRADGQAEE